MPQTAIASADALPDERADRVRRETPTAAANGGMDVAERGRAEAGAATPRIAGRDRFGDTLPARGSGPGRAILMRPWRALAPRAALSATPLEAS